MLLGIGLEFSVRDISYHFFLLLLQLNVVLDSLANNLKRPDGVCYMHDNVFLHPLKSIFRLFTDSN
jgi:hypothetical protein